MLSIKGIEVFRTNLEMKKPFKVARYGIQSKIENIIVKIYSKNDIIGIGEVSLVTPLYYSGEICDTIANVIKHYLMKAVINEDPFNITKIWNKMNSIIKGNRLAKVVIDMALYDLIGKSLNLPVCKLIGGLNRKEFPSMGAIGAENTEESIKEAIKQVKEGFKVLKIKALGTSPKKEIERIQQIIETIGDEIELVLDANAVWDFKTALRIIKSLEKYHNIYFEQPTDIENIKALAILRNNTTAPIIADESAFTFHGLLEIIHLQAADYVNVKITQTAGGGFFNVLTAIRLLENADIKITIDDAPATEIVGSACAHLAAIVNEKSYWYFAHAPGWMNIKKSPVKKGGVKVEQPPIVTLPSAPGLGIEELDETLLIRI